MKWTVRPLSDVTGFNTERQESQFTTNWSGAVTLLERELDQIRARDVVLELDVRDDEIRLDGQLRGDARVASGRVRLAFDSRHGALVYATNRFTRGAASVGYGNDRKQKMRHDWQHNVYAIAKALEALRLVDRYGVNTGQQYTGSKALPAGRAMPASHMTRTEALGVFGVWGRALHDLPPIPAEYVNTDPVVLTGMYRAARRAAHPDRNNGDQTAWDQVEQAANVLGVSQ